MTDFSMTTITPEETPTTREISICGAMTIHHAGEIRSALLEALAEADAVQLDLKKVTEIDLIGLQLICSTHRTAVSERKLFTVMGTDDAVIKASALSGGFFRHVGCVQDVDHTCIWTGGGK